MLTVDNINLHYGAAQALRGVSHYCAEPGKITCVLGRNGVGKTSAAARHHRPAWAERVGAIAFDGTELNARWRPMTGRRRGIGFVPQGREIFPAADGRRRTCE
jgi:urea transport system ATP-binding protein